MTRETRDEIIRKLIKEGRTALPVLPNSKQPGFIDKNGKPQPIRHQRYQSERPSNSQMREWFANPATGVGILCTDDKPVLDIDRKNFDSQQDCDDFLKSLNIPKDVYIERSKSGGYHVQLSLKGGKDFTNFPKGELLGDGRFVVIAPTEGYEVIQQGKAWEIESIDQLGLKPEKPQTVASEPVKNTPLVYNAGKPIDLLHCCVNRQQDAFVGSAPSDTSKEITSFAREVYGWENWLRQNNILYNGSADSLVRELADRWGKADKLDRILQSINREDCMPYRARYGEASLKQRVDQVIKKAYPATKSGDEGAGDKASQITQQAYEIFQQLDLRFNSLTKEVELNGVPLGEDFYIDVRLEYGVGISKELAFDLAAKIAKQNSYSPVVEYLERCYQEHGSDTSILDGLAARLFGSTNPMHETFFKKWSISAVARALDPGCKVDTALILHGKQGALKSSVFSTLASLDWFDDSIGAPSDKDERLKLHQSWILEWAELESVFRRKERSEVKAFMTCRVDKLRPPYGRLVESMPRASVIVGTTNEDEFLSDPTGSRRFWVISLAKDWEIDIDWLKEHRDQIWGAAVALYKQGEKWWLSREEEKQAAEIADKFKSSDTWAETIQEWLEQGIDLKSEVTVSQIMNDALKLDIGRQGRAEQMRVASALKSLGWSMKVTKKGGSSVRVWSKEEDPIGVVEYREKIAPQPEPQPDPQPLPEPPKGYTEGAPVERLSGGEWRNGWRVAEIDRQNQRLWISPPGGGSPINLRWDDESVRPCAARTTAFAPGHIVRIVSSPPGYPPVGSQHRVLEVNGNMLKIKWPIPLIGANHCELVEQEVYQESLV